MKYLSLLSLLALQTFASPIPNNDVHSIITTVQERATDLSARDPQIYGHIEAVAGEKDTSLEERNINLYAPRPVLDGEVDASLESRDINLYAPRPVPDGEKDASM